MVLTSIYNSSEDETIHAIQDKNLNNIQATADKEQVTFTLHNYQAMTVSKKNPNVLPLMLSGIGPCQSPTISTLEICYWPET